LTPRLRLASALLFLLLAGCSDARFLNRTCPQPPNPKMAAAVPAPDARYRVGCPDVLEIRFTDRPDWDALVAIDLDGSIPVGYDARPRIEGLTLDEVREAVAQETDVPPSHVGVALAAPRSKAVYVHGPVRGRLRVIPYQGPVPVIDFLKRVGGLPPGSKLNQVYIVRPNVATARAPEVLRVDVAAVLVDGNPATNYPLQPADQVYVGETRGSIFSRVLPNWLGTIYRRLTGLLPDNWWRFIRP
jgi:protein involved in polysaccharide export with SLBB domain